MWLKLNISQLDFLRIERLVNTTGDSDTDQRVFKKKKLINFNMSPRRIRDIFLSFSAGNKRAKIEYQILIDNIQLKEVFGKAKK